MLWSALLVAVALPAATQDLDARPSFLQNGSFEDGFSAWATSHSWYEMPQGGGKGTSVFVIDSTSPREGARCARVEGVDTRGIILQNVPLREEPLRLSGWVRCEGLGEVEAAIQAEWIGEGNEYLGASRAGGVRGDADWTRVSGDLTPPEGAVLARVECLTTAPNTGRAWFDDVRLVSLAGGDGTPPPPVPFRAYASRWLTGVVHVDWLTYRAPDDIGQYRVYISTEPLTDTGELVPAALAAASRSSAVIRDLQPGVEYSVTVVPVDRFGNYPPAFRPQTVTPSEGGAPALEVTPLVGPTGALGVRLTPPLGVDPPVGYIVRSDCNGKRRTHRCGPNGRLAIADLPHDTAVALSASTASAGDSAPRASALVRTLPEQTIDVSTRADVVGRVVSADGAPLAGAIVMLSCPGAPLRAAQTGPDGAFSLKPARVSGPAAAWLYASAEGYMGSRAPVLLGGGGTRAQVSLAPTDTGIGDVWTAPPLAHIFRDDPPPADPTRGIHLLAGRNETECYQVAIRPTRELADLRVVFDDLRRADGKQSISADGFSARFVNHVLVEENSRATPPEELLRPAPDYFPDELSDDPSRTVAADAAQAVFLSFDIPPGTPPGIYGGSVYLETDLGLHPIPITVEVVPVDFPENPRLWVVNWFSVDSFANRYGLKEYGFEWWAMLREYARMFHRHHQNVVTVSPGLCEIWVEADGARTYDWSRFDRWCRTFLDEGVGRLNVTHLGGRGPGGWEAPEFILHDRPAKERATGATTSVPVTEFAAELEKHLKKRGWLEITNLHIADEPIPVNVESWTQESSRIHAAAPGLKRMEAIQVPDLRGFCELWVPQLNYFDQWHGDYDRWRRAGEMELWFYVAWVPQEKYPNRLIDTESIKPRVVHWFNYLYGATGYLHWGLNHWHIKFGAFSPGDEWMTWPGRDGPNSSLRYEAQREGLEDCEYLHMLEDAYRDVVGELDAEGFDPAARSHEVGRSVVRAMTDYTKSYTELQAARETLLREIASLKEAPLAVVRTEPGTGDAISPGEVNVWGVVEPGCSVVVNGQRARLDGNRFLVRLEVTTEAPNVSVRVSKGRAEKEFVRRFRVGE